MKKVDDRYFINNSKKSDFSIEDSLSNDESLLWKGKPLRKSFILNSVLKYLPFALIWLIFDTLFIVLLAINVKEIPTIVIVFLTVFFLFHLIPVWLWIYSIISASKRQKVEEYAFTNKRILIKQGFIGSTVISIFYDSINSVNLKIGLIEKMCHVGDIYILSNNQKVVLEDILDPVFITTKLQDIALTNKKDIYFPNNLRKWLTTDEIFTFYKKDY